MPLRSGSRLGAYEILGPLGAGGMGEVYRARDPRLGREVAIKILPAELTQDAAARERLRREAMAAAALDHPYVCKVFEIGQAPDPAGSEDVRFLVLEYVPG
ncbi:MAG: protein kinase domain-containing protein, partial [Hyphomicrobiales bacterium]